MTHIEKQIKRLEKELQKDRKKSNDLSNQYYELEEFGWSEEHQRLSGKITMLDYHCCLLSNEIKLLKELHSLN